VVLQIQQPAVVVEQRTAQARRLRLGTDGDHCTNGPLTIRHTVLDSDNLISHFSTPIVISTPTVAAEPADAPADMIAQIAQTFT